MVALGGGVLWFGCLLLLMEVAVAYTGFLALIDVGYCWLMFLLLCMLSGWGICFLCLVVLLV